MTNPERGLVSRLLTWIGVDRTSSSTAELAVATVGSLIAMSVVFIVSEHIPAAEHLLLVASTGASAVLIFTIPHGRLSQPWPVIVGHCVCALIGVSCARWLGTEPVVAMLTVSLCIFAMVVCRCVHPPAGATALTAVLGGPQITDLGYSFVLSPVLINMLTLVLVAVLINLPFRWRRYPASISWQRRQPAPPSVDRQDLQYALSKIDTFLDINENDLMRIYEIARRRADGSAAISPEDIAVGACFSNGEFGSEWQVREVVSINGDQIDYRIAAGDLKGDTGESAANEFRKWVAYRVVRDGDSWNRVALAEKT